MAPPPPPRAREVRSARDEPAQVRHAAGALADWIASFTMPAPLAAEMADACAAGAAWPAAIGAAAVRRAGWPDAKALAWGVAVGALAGGLEAARASLAAADAGPAARGDEPGVARPARVLLAADGLIAAAHEALGTLGPERLPAALEALADEFGDGGPWGELGGRRSGAAWPSLVACALAPAAAHRPEGPWGPCAAAWRRAFGAGGGPGGKPGRGILERQDLWRPAAADPEARRLLEAAARVADRPGKAGSG